MPCLFQTNLPLKCEADNDDTIDDCNLNLNLTEVFFNNFFSGEEQQR
jgi:hypothetical protein